MFFQNIVATENMLPWLAQQIDAIRPVAQYGIDITIAPHKKIRTYQQNRYYAAVICRIIQFYQETGFRPDNLRDWEMKPEVLREWAKDKFGILTTTKLSTKEFGEFVDKVQAFMMDASFGNYQPIIPEDIQFEAYGYGV